MYIYLLKKYKQMTITNQKSLQIQSIHPIKMTYFGGMNVQIVHLTYP